MCPSLVKISHVNTCLPRVCGRGRGRGRGHVRQCACCISARVGHSGLRAERVSLAFLWCVFISCTHTLCIIHEFHSWQQRYAPVKAAIVADEKVADAAGKLNAFQVQVLAARGADGWPALVAAVEAKAVAVGSDLAGIWGGLVRGRLEW